MIRRTPRSTRTDTLFPYTTLFRSLPAGFEIGRAIVDDDDVISVPGKSLGMQRRQAVVELPPLMQMGDDDRYPVRTAPWHAAFVSFALFLRIFRVCPAI